MNSRWILILWAGLLLACSQLALHAQQYSIDRFKIAGGGGTSTGGVYSVSGTIGQAEASAPMTNGRYSVTGGFWSLIATVQTPGAPLLTVTFSGNDVVVSWSSSTTDFVLQQNSDLTTTNWSDVGLTVNDDGTNRNVSFPIPTGNLFFRLKQ